ncbi:MAG TPA: amidase [Candidatus Acidoferrales bacterium]|nr:amidase [Candidatus Acidoferrales bacterium]
MTPISAPDESALAWLPVEAVASLVARRKISPVELVELAARRIERLNPRLNLFLGLTLESARGEARRLEAEIGRGRRRGPLHGIPVSIKDNIWVRGVPMTAGSKILAQFIPRQDATLVRRLRRAGAIVIGKTLLHEFAYGITTENPHYGPVRNPWAPARIVGGSSGGSAAALAAGIGWGSMGTDTGGSIRVPAALCGVVGLKPTFGRVSCYGVFPLSASLDHAGPLATSVTGAAWLLGAVAGRDRLDPGTHAAPGPAADYAGSFRRSLGRVRLGLPLEFFFDGIDSEVRSGIEAAAGQFERLGASIARFRPPALARWVEAATEIAQAEARHYHEKAGLFPAQAAEYGDDVRRLLEHGATISAPAYLAAMDLMRAARGAWEQSMAGFDALLAPTTPIAATPIGAKTTTIGTEEQTVRAALLRLARPANFAGAPALALPCGFTRGGLPIGLQLIGPHWSEARLLRIGYAYEQAEGWTNRRPPGI